MQRAVEEHPTSAFIKGSVADLILEIITSKSTNSARAWKTEMENEIKNQNGNRNENRKLQIQTRGLRGAEVDLLRNSLQQMVDNLWDVLREEETAKVGTRTGRVGAPNEQRRTTKAAVLPGCKRSGRSKRR